MNDIECVKQLKKLNVVPSLQEYRNILECVFAMEFKAFLRLFDLFI